MRSGIVFRRFVVAKKYTISKLTIQMPSGLAQSKPSGAQFEMIYQVKVVGLVLQYVILAENAIIMS